MQATTDTLTVQDIRDAIRSIRQAWDVPMAKRTAVAEAVRRTTADASASSRVQRAAADFWQAADDANWLPNEPADEVS